MDTAKHRSVVQGRKKMLKKMLKKLCWGALALLMIAGGWLLFCFSDLSYSMPARTSLDFEQPAIIFRAELQTGYAYWCCGAGLWGFDLWAFDLQTNTLSRWKPLPGANSFQGEFDWLPFEWTPATSFYPAADTLAFRRDNKGAVYLVHRTGLVEQLDAAPEWQHCIFFSPDRKLVAYTVKDENYELLIQDVLSLQIVGRVPLDMYVDQVFWSPDNTHIAFVQGGSFDFSPTDQTTLYVVRADGSALTQLSPALPGGIYSLAWSPDSQHIAFGQAIKTEEGAAQLWIVDSAGGVPEAWLPPQQGQWAMYRDLAWSADGQQIAYVVDGMLGVERAGSLGILDLRTAETTLVIDGTDRDYWYDVTALAWAPGEVPVIVAAVPEDKSLRCVEIGGSDERTACSTNLFLVDPQTGVLTQLTHRQFWYARSDRLTWW